MLLHTALIFSFSSSLNLLRQRFFYIDRALFSLLGLCEDLFRRLLQLLVCAV